MPYIIPISLPEGAPITDPPTSVTGSLPELWRPKDGDWKITLLIYSDSSCPVQALIEVLQPTDQKGDTVIASTKCMVTGAPDGCMMSLSATDAVLKGACSISGLKVRVTPQEHCSWGCCPDPGPPLTLNMTMTGDYSGSGTLTSGGGPVWLGNIDATPNGDWPGGTFCIQLLCNEGFNTPPGTYNWSIVKLDCFCGFSSWGTGPYGNAEIVPGSGTCVPFKQTFSGVSSNCSGDPIPPPYHAFTLVVEE